MATGQTLTDLLLNEINDLEQQVSAKAQFLASKQTELQNLNSAIQSFQTVGAAVPGSLSSQLAPLQAYVTKIQIELDQLQKVLATKQANYDKLLMGYAENIGKGIDEETALTLAESELKAEQLRTYLKYGAYAAGALILLIITIAVIKAQIEKMRAKKAA